MKTTELKILVASALLFTSASAQALQPEVLYGFRGEGSDNFTNATGANPVAALVLGSDGNFYGTTSQGGSNGYGTVFQITTNGVLATLVSFPFRPGGNCEGASPSPSRLVLGNDGSFYGATAGCPFHLAKFSGSIFRVTTNGVLTRLATNVWLNPSGGLLLGADGEFYGTTWDTVFKVSTNGDVTTLAQLTAANGSGAQGLVRGRDGALYGTTEVGGSGGGGGAGAVFKVTNDGVVTSLASFNNTNGAYPQGALVLGSNGAFYGTTSRSVFEMTTNGLVRSLVSFNCTNGCSPAAGLVLGKDGQFLRHHHVWRQSAITGRCSE